MLLFMSANPRAEQSDSTCMPPFGKEYASRTTWEIQCNRSAHTAQFSIDLNHLGMHFAHSKKWGFTLGQCTRCSTWGSILVPSSREHAVQTRTLPLYRLGSSLAALTCTRANHVQHAVADWCGVRGSAVLASRSWLQGTRHVAESEVVAQ